jgi:Amt family ammonium transporter
MVLEWLRFGRPSLVGIVTGLIGGLATITPASGYVGPSAAVCLGFIAGIVCFFAVDAIKHRIRIDDSLDVFAVHGVGGIVGTLATAVFASAALGGAGYAEGMNPSSQLSVQALGVAATVAWSAVMTWGILKVVGALTGLRVDDEQATQGLDLTTHGESGYNIQI